MEWSFVETRRTQLTEKVGERNRPCSLGQKAPEHPDRDEEEGTDSLQYL